MNEHEQYPMNQPIKNDPTPQDQPGEGIALEADYAEDRSVALLAERRREFQASLLEQYSETEMPAS